MSHSMPQPMPPTQTRRSVDTLNQIWGRRPTVDEFLQRQGSCSKAWMIVDDLLYEATIGGDARWGDGSGNLSHVGGEGPVSVA